MQLCQDAFEKSSPSAFASYVKGLGLWDEELFDFLASDSLVAIFWKSSVRAGAGSCPGHLDISARSEYFDFLERRKQDNPLLSEYVSSIAVFAGLAPSFHQGLVSGCDHLDFANDDHRLVIALHFLTLASWGE